jgi:hypothetical protein
MTDYFSFLYRFLIHPNQTLESYKTRTPAVAGLFVVFLMSFSDFSFLGLPSVASTMWTVVLLFLGYVIVLFIQATLLDFIAQWFQPRAQSLRLFSWLAVSWLPSLGLLPLANLSAFGSAAWAGIFGLVSFIIGVYIMILQVRMIKVLYHLPRSTAFFVYTLQVLAPVVVLGLVVFFLFQIGMSTAAFTDLNWIPQL